jgi:hypothetical protein
VLHSRAGQRALRWLSVASSPHQIRIRQTASPPERAGSRPAVSPLRFLRPPDGGRNPASCAGIPAASWAHLARADSEGRIEKLLDRYLAPIAGHELIAAANAIQGAADIALAKPHLADRIARGNRQSEAAPATPRRSAATYRRRPRHPGARPLLRTHSEEDAGAGLCGVAARTIRVPARAKRPKSFGPSGPAGSDVGHALACPRSFLTPSPGSR